MKFGKEPNPPLLQTSTHGSPDTDADPASLHHTIGSGANQVVAGNDVRLTDARIPSGTAGGDLAGTYPNPTIKLLSIVDGDVAVANKDGVTGTFSMRTLGTGTQQAAQGSHKYHPFANGQHYFDDYSQGQYLRLFTETAAYTQTRFCPVSSVEYWNGSAWVTWVGGDAIVKNMLDGLPNTSAAIDHTHRRFRFIITKNAGWALTALIALTGNWTAITFVPMTVIIEDSATIGGVYTLRETCVFGAGTTQATHGTHMKVSSNMHTGLVYQRVEINITDWVDSGVYLTIPLQSFEIYSNYTGGSQLPFNWNYDKLIAFTALSTTGAATIGGALAVTGASTVGGQAVVVTNDVRLALVNLGAGADLNTYITTGRYQQTSNVNATLLLNYPATFAGTLEVTTYGSFHTQRYTTYKDNLDRVYVRGYYFSWSTWTELAKTNDPRFVDARTPLAHNHSAVDLTSGTLAIARGGTNNTVAPTLNGVVYGDGTQYKSTAAATTKGVFRATTAGGIPAFGTIDFSYMPSAWTKETVWQATTENIVLSGEQDIDGEPGYAGFRYLVKNQTNPIENGIYMMEVGTWTRSTDTNVGGELLGAMVPVVGGLTQKGTRWTTTFDPNIGDVVGSSPILWFEVAQRADQVDAAIATALAEVTIIDGGLP